MWAYTDSEIDYLSRGRAAAESLSRVTDKGRLAPLLSRWSGRLRAWLGHRAVRAELHQLDARTLADLGINRGDFPAILAGTYSGPWRGAASDHGTAPRGELASRTLAMPADAN